MSMLRFLDPSTPISDAKLRRQFESRADVRPRLSHQKAWANAFAPELEYDFSEKPWKLLQQFTLPLFHRYASAAHREGARVLGLDVEKEPDFAKFSARVEEVTGWTVVETRGEMLPPDYFAALAERKFPCIPKLRNVNEVLCGKDPDFWHEAIGHLAPLVSPEVSRFYQNCGALHAEVLRRFGAKRAAELNGFFWLILEYGFIREGAETKAFGAAIAGSFVALTKWRSGAWAIRSFDIEAILNAGIAYLGAVPKRDERGRVIFYEIYSLAETFEALRKHAFR
jgi:phenylalanine-4-hydroxylase